MQMYVCCGFVLLRLGLKAARECFHHQDTVPINCCQSLPPGTVDGVAYLLIIEYTSWSSQEEYCGSHVRVLPRTTSRVRHLTLEDALVILV